ncbi:hypothetical protein BOTBODRAFT_50464 [Botryobasidium botryosum FD-172 SS1]|uniref:Uncharacterized protein n=1 Tax=Botryobasidium botryosum (strain FD-172 SS1) TaxID=930990 RepID=A0A067NDU4_BOTB1|nr:hypothetical protein BOTBODRAFT_50464 [Botryobasidium botryosum FD-172 SS1]
MNSLLYSILHLVLRSLGIWNRPKPLSHLHWYISCLISTLIYIVSFNTSSKHSELANRIIFLSMGHRYIKRRYWIEYLILATFLSLEYVLPFAIKSTQGPLVPQATCNYICRKLTHFDDLWQSVDSFLSHWFTYPSEFIRLFRQSEMMIEFMISGIIIAKALQYDYGVHLLRTGNRSLSFPKPYFTVTMLTYVIAHIVDEIGIPHAHPLTRYISPLCVLSLFIAAMIRGEVKAFCMWKHKPLVPKGVADERGEGLAAAKTE